MSCEGYLMCDRWGTMTHSGPFVISKLRRERGKLFSGCNDVGAGEPACFGTFDVVESLLLAVPVSQQ